MTGTYSHWLLKAEPDSRMVKTASGKEVDIKFSLDDFRGVGVSSWEGVRNHQAKNFLKSQMKAGHKCLFYQSSCKTPGVVGLCEVVKEGYPDHNAWDPSHPYYDPKSSPDSPTWYMVDVRFNSQLPSLVSLKLLQTIADYPKPPSEVAYLSQKHLDAIKNMFLIKRGRLSVQPVEGDAYDAVVLLGQKGGFEALLETKKSPAKKRKSEVTSDAGEGEVDEATQSAKVKGKKIAVVKKEVTSEAKEEPAAPPSSNRPGRRGRKPVSYKE